jgi:hypothetical protein
MRTDAGAKIWQAMRGLPHFTCDEIETMTGCNYAVIRNHISILMSAGYIKVIGKSENNRYEKVYKLIKNTGPKPPTKRLGLYDPNTNEILFKQPKGPSACG